MASLKNWTKWRVYHANFKQKKNQKLNNLQNNKRVVLLTKRRKKRSKNERWNPILHKSTKSAIYNIACPTLITMQFMALWWVKLWRQIPIWRMSCIIHWFKSLPTYWKKLFALKILPWCEAMMAKLQRTTLQMSFHFHLAIREILSQTLMLQQLSSTRHLERKVTRKIVIWRQISLNTLQIAFWRMKNWYGGM